MAAHRAGTTGAPAGRSADHDHDHDHDSGYGYDYSRVYDSNHDRGGDYVRGRGDDDDGGYDHDRDAARAGAAGARAVFLRFWPFTRPDRGLLLCAGLLLVAGTAAETAAIWLFGHLTDRALVRGSLRAFWVPAGLWLLIASAGGLSELVGRNLEAKASGNLLGRLRAAMFQRLQAMSPTFFTERPAGDLVTRFNADIEAVDDLAGSGVIDAVTTLLGIVCFAGAALVLRWELALLAFCSAPVYWLFTRRSARKVHDVSRTERVAAGSIASVVEENIVASALVQAYSAQTREQERLRRWETAWRGARLAAHRLANTNAALATFLETLCVLSVLAVGTWEISAGRLTVGGLLSFAGFLGYLYGPLQNLGHLVTTVGSAVTAGERILELLDHPQEVRDTPGARRLRGVHGQVRFERVSLRYPGSPRPALDAVSFTLAPGGLTVVTGSSGAGKSTLTRLLPRLQDPSAGRILLDGRDLREVTLASLRRAITVVPQDSPLLDLTLRENIAWGGQDASAERIVAAAEAAGVHEFVGRLPDGYDTRLGPGGRRLSGGQRQRVAIARAMVRDTPILVLDEPTAGLDDVSAGQLLRSLRGLAAWRTILVVTHDLRLAASADWIVVLDQGRVAGQGTHRDLLARGGPYAWLHAGGAPAQPRVDDAQRPGRPAARTVSGPEWPGGRARRAG